MEAAASTVSPHVRARHPYSDRQEAGRGSSERTRGTAPPDLSRTRQQASKLRRRYVSGADHVMRGARSDRLRDQADVAPRAPIDRIGTITTAPEGAGTCSWTPSARTLTPLASGSAGARYSPIALHTVDPGPRRDERRDRVVDPPHLLVLLQRHARLCNPRPHKRLDDLRVVVDNEVRYHRHT